ncbi:MAG: flagellar protein [Shinella sp.]|nr:flagellar protein [Shinella sp.]
MTDFDADEAVQPIRRDQSEKYSLTDRMLIGAGLLLAGMAAFFPWYVFLNQDKFSVPPLWENGKRELPDTAGRNVMGVSPSAMLDDDSRAPAGNLDPVSTATVPGLGAERTTGAPAEITQPLPGAAGFRLMHVANGRALIEDTSGMYIVRIGSVLPDNSRLATLEQRNGKWVIVTSNGDIYQGQ